MRKTLYILVIVIGFLQIVGFVTGIKPIRNLGVVTASSPLPIVFTEVKGVETFASDFYLRYTDANGETYSLQLTPEIYAKFKGPYNRRNVYGAAIAYGPVLPEELWSTVLNYGLCNDVLSNELGIPKNATDVSILIKTRTKGRNDEWTLDTNCTP